MTGLLFGLLVKHNVVSSITLGIVLRHVLDALKKPPRSSMFMFGLNALRQFVTGLAQLPPFCVQLLQVGSSSPSSILLTSNLLFRKKPIQTPYLSIYIYIYLHIPFPVHSFHSICSHAECMLGLLQIPAIKEVEPELFKQVEALVISQQQQELGLGTGANPGDLQV